MESDEIIKLVDGIYKNILDKFNPGTKQLINAGKAYLKALHGAAAASRMYVDAISKLARQAQQGTWGGSSDIAAALMKVVEVYKEIQDQQMNILKAFYVDLVVPIELNLEKDTKVVQTKHKEFFSDHKQHSETYSKAAAMMKKQRKKSKGSTKTGLAMDKELKNMQVLEEEKTKLDAFYERSLKDAMTQERRRYGFVLERQCSMAKHYLSYHRHGVAAYQDNLEKWCEVAMTREYLPESVESIFSNRLRLALWQDEDVYSNPRSPNFDEDRMSTTSQLRKTKSMDASCLDLRSMNDVASPVTTLNRAKSEFNLNSSTNSLAQDERTPTRRPKSMAVPPPPTWDTQLARALYAYLSSGENQLSFHEGDLIALIGERNKGWQFGENLRTQCTGWFPLAYAEVLDDPTFSPTHRVDTGGSSQHNNIAATPTSGHNMTSSTGSGTTSGNSTLEPPQPRMFGDTLHLHRSSNNAKQIRRAIGSSNVPPPALPAPVPTPSLPYQKTGLTQSQSTNFPSTKNAHIEQSTYQSQYSQTTMKSSASSFNFTTPATGSYSTHPQPARADRPTAGTPLPLHLQPKGGKIGGPVGNVSLHSSNDSGFSNDPPPQPEIDYSDDDSIAVQTKLPSRRVPRERRERVINGDSNNNIKRKPPPMKQSSSHGNLVDNRFYMSDGPDSTNRERRNLVKRTKSFWKFGKNKSDNELLEGMSMWKHRDLVDVEDEKPNKKRVNSQRRVRKPSRDKSNDSDRTINAKQSEVVEKPKENGKKMAEVKHRPSFKKDSKLSLPPQKGSNKKVDDYEENIYDIEKPMKIDDQFYEDDDGLMLKTVNRKNILQQYSNDSSGPETESDSDMTSDDPYDCIVVDDQNVQTNDNQFPNVAELGKKLEKLSRSSKYSPNKEKAQMRNTVEEKNNINLRNHTETRIHTEAENGDIIQYNEKRHTFKTFGLEIQNNENGEKERVDDRYYSQSTKRSNESNAQEKRRQYTESSNRNSSQERRGRPSYESVEVEREQRNRDSRTNNSNNRRSQAENDKRETQKQKYYDSTNDELSDATENRQFLPRTKLSKTNSNSSKYEQDIGLMEYGETLQKRLKDPEYGSKFDEKSPHNGNMYGPWYDLWGLDSSVRK